MRLSTTMRASGLRTVGRLLVAAFVLATVATVVGPAAHPAGASASTASSMEAYLVKWINDARTSRGVPKLSVGEKLTKYAGARASSMASKNKLAHPSCLGCDLNARDISWNTCGEVIASTNSPYGLTAAKSLFNAWKGSPGHWSLLMSSNFKRFGVGVAYRSSNHTSFASAVLARG